MFVPLAHCHGIIHDRHYPPAATAGCNRTCRIRKVLLYVKFTDVKMVVLFTIQIILCVFVLQSPLLISSVQLIAL
jgi:hypothetical protein